MSWISEEARQRILDLPHFRDSHHAQLDLDAVLSSYVHAYARPALRMAGGRVDFTVADIGAGYGWLAIAFALCSDARIIAADSDAERLATARAIAAILGVGHRIEWRHGALGSLPFVEGEADLACCLELIEHAGTDGAVLHDLGRITRDLLLVSTPNGALPVVLHDTALPFCHWLPSAWRDAYAGMFGRRHLQDNNRFWGPRRLTAALPEFQRVSGFFQYERHAHFQEAQEILRATPTGQRKAPSLYPAYCRLAATLGAKSFYALPNLASVWRRRPQYRLAETARYDLADMGLMPARAEERAAETVVLA
jgi:2-polyprenyl-3-methyl-5-hydroxy-6-metoxy-1,4-benzoquinol methylase